MLLAIDIGNSNIVFGLFRGERLLKKICLPTSGIGTGKPFSQKIKRDFYAYDIKTIVICSVVPRVERPMVGILKRLFKTKPLVFGKDIKVPIRNLYKRPGQVGQDRLVNAYAGYVIYGAPLIIVDFGTAVTFDVVSKAGSYAGGIIVPGVELSLNTLSEKAALLPRIKLARCTSLLGKTTTESMTSGILHGYAALCDGMVSKLKKRLGMRFYVVATGGNAHLISHYSLSIKKLDDNLILKGINLIFRRAKKGGK